MRRPALAVVVLLSLNVVLCAQLPISAKHFQATQTQKAGAPLESAELPTFNVGKFPIGITFEGTNIWVANGGSNTVTKLRASDGAVLENFTVGTLPLQVVFDGANIWVTNGRSNSVSKLKR